MAGSPLQVFSCVFFFCLHGHEMCKTVSEGAAVTISMHFNVVHSCHQGCIRVWCHIYANVSRYVNTSNRVLCVFVCDLRYMFMYEGTRELASANASSWECFHLCRDSVSACVISIQMCICVCVCVCTEEHESSLPFMYIEFLFCSLYLSAPIWQMHINRWSTEERGSWTRQKGRTGRTMRAKSFVSLHERKTAHDESHIVVACVSFVSIFTTYVPLIHPPATGFSIRMLLFIDI